MSNYVEQMWESQSYGVKQPSKSGAVLAWIVGIVAVISIAAYASQSYWYPYVSPYLTG